MKFVPFIFTLFLALLFVLPAVGESEFYTEMPPFLRFSQETLKETIEEDVHILRTYPDTASDQVDADMRALIDAMVQDNRDLLSPPTGSVPSYLDVGAIISRTGTSVLSFLTLAEVTKDMEHLSVDFHTRVYDIQTGELLSLSRFLARTALPGHTLAMLCAVSSALPFPTYSPTALRLTDCVRPKAFAMPLSRLAPPG